MLLLSWYRMYAAIIAGAAVYFLAIRHWWMWVLVTVALRIVWLLTEWWINNRLIEVSYKKHSGEFKQLCGPYGIRIANKAESDFAIKKSLCEVFVDNKQALKKTVDQLEMMNTLFNAGMRPDGDTFQLHDLKLKYGRHRLEKQ